jgi:hypothetical protein
VETASVWAIEGLLYYLSGDEQESLIEAISRMTSDGSVVGADGATAEGIPTISLPGASNTTGQSEFVATVDPRVVWTNYGFSVRMCSLAELPVGRARWTPLPLDPSGGGQFFVRARRTVQGADERSTNSDSTG